MTGEAAPSGAAPRRRAGLSRRAILLALAIAALLLLAGAALAAFRYLPALDDARTLRTGLETMVERVQEAGLGIDRTSLDALDADLASASSRLGALRSLLASDPLVGMARLIPFTASNVRGADDVVAAAGDLLVAVGDGLAIGHRFVEIREAQAADPRNAAALSQLVELMATSRDRAVAASAAVASARRTLARVPDGLLGQVESVRDAMTARIEKYGPLLDTYVAVSARLPAILGWDGPRRYLILTQDPAELRPSGGLIGSYGIIAFDHGRIIERRFQSVSPLDGKTDYPFARPPQELADYLLGHRQSWQLADAGWSPDFPTSAQDALRLYVNESGDTRIDGVLGITTSTIDELLKVTGPISVPDYGATIASGETTLKVLQLTRAPRKPGEDAKTFLPVFADRLFGSLFALPPKRWGDLLGETGTFGQERLLLAWFRDATDEAFAADGGFGGAIRQDRGDFVYPVDSNVAPATKLNLWTARSMDLSVQIDAVGNARNTLAVTWENRVDTPDGIPYRAMTNVGGRILGMYFRLLVPERSRVEAVSGGGLAPVTDPAVVEDVAGRMAIGTYLKIPPGPTSLRYIWTSPYAANADATGGSYRLTVQAQP
ncbi:MAG TPA: DUF4012 domain-containing protein, partial [Candidatus Limnocylindrales bacterium]